MARKAAPSSTPDPKNTVIDALLALAAEKAWSEFRMPDVAERAGISLVEMRRLFPSRGAIIAAYMRKVDDEVLETLDPDLANEPARERLFDVLMQRLAVLKPHREAVATISRAFGHDPMALAAMNGLVVKSMQWMLMAAGIGAEGPLGSLRAQGLALAWSRILKVWVKDDDPGIARTMTEIDRQLRSGERWLERLDDLYAAMRPFRRMAERSRKRRSRMAEHLRGRFRDFSSGRRDDRDDDDTREAGAQ